VNAQRQIATLANVDGMDLFQVARVEVFEYGAK